MTQTKRHKNIIHDIDRHGNERWYLRLRRRGKWRLPGPPGSEGFDEAVLEGMQRLPAQRPLALAVVDLKARGFVYFLRVGETVKIGFSRNLTARIEDLKVGLAHRIDTFVAAKGDAADERRLHRMFATARLSGEWFTATPPLRQAMARAAVYGDAKAIISGTDTEQTSPTLPRSLPDGLSHRS